jgi:hypothetical protein
MKTVFLRDYKQVINKHPKSWNTPCVLPRDSDCGEYLDTRSISRIDNTMKVVEWKVNGKLRWTHFNEIYITKPTKILGKSYKENVKEI